MLGSLQDMTSAWRDVHECVRKVEGGEHVDPLGIRKEFQEWSVEVETVIKPGRVRRRERGGTSS